uniref:CCHC-type domain-containing protein n=1 Tax=Tanacetum cinerariifolium TaxID=118510 RepID=A0A6L2MUL0_TANCI|nr:hypothetical protein [Tanacetum cinerariifolium]
MAPTRRTTRASLATTTTTTPITNAQLKKLIDQGVANTLTARDADRSRNGDDNHNSGTGSRKTKRTTRECTYTDFLKCQPMNFKGTEGVVGAAHGMSWNTLIKMMTAKYCPRNEIKKLEIKIWELKVKESDKIEKYISGLPDMIHESVMASKPKTMQGAVEFATELMDKKIRTFAKRQTENKRKQYNNQHQQNKRQNTSRVGHMARDCRSHAATNNQRNLTCYECENQWHYRSDCPELKNQNHKNQAGRTRARGMVHALGGGKTNQDLNNMEDDINA